ncbi:phosphatidylserine decarboxylase [Thiomicrolovo sp. ZZH C-3]
MNGLRDLIVKEGWRSVGIAAAAALFFALFDCDLMAWLFIAAAGYLLWKYRKPARTATYFEKGSVTAPCDGRVTAIDTLPDGSVSVEIETGWFDATLLTAPFVEGVPSGETVTRGARLGSRSPLAGMLNERGSILFEDEEGRSIRLTHRLAQTPAPLLIDAYVPGKRRLRGERYGVLTHGVTRLQLPASTRVAVNPGDRVYATRTLLGYMR